MSNKLVTINGGWYKIKKFFRNIFFKGKSYNKNETKIINNEQINSNFVHDNNLKEKFEIANKQQNLANKLLYGEIGTSELNENEVDEMIEYFTKDIQNIDNELLRIRQHILAMRQELE